MWPMPIVAMEPVDQLGRALIRVVIGLGIGPFAQSSLDETLCLAVGFGRVGLGEDLAQAVLLADCSEPLRPIT